MSPRAVRMTGAGAFELDGGPRFEVVYNLAFRERRPGAAEGRGTIRPLVVGGPPQATLMNAAGEKGTLFLEDGRRVKLLVKSASSAERVLVVGVDGPVLEVEGAPG